MNAQPEPESARSHIADWVLREGAEKIVTAGAGEVPYYGATTILRLLGTIDAVQALAEEWATHTDDPRAYAAARILDAIGREPINPPGSGVDQ